MLYDIIHSGLIGMTKGKTGFQWHQGKNRFRAVTTNPSKDLFNIIYIN